MCWYWQPPQRWKYGHPGVIARRRWLQHFDQPAAPQIVLRALDFGAHHFARQDEGNQNNFALQTRQAFAAVHQLFNR